MISNNTSNIDETSGNKKTLQNRLFRFLFALTSVIVFLYLLVNTGYYLINNVTDNQLNWLDNITNLFAYYMTFVRLSIYLVIYVFWNKVILWLGYINKWEDNVIQNGQQNRSSTFIIIALIEFFLISRVHLILYDLISTWSY